MILIQTYDMDFLMVYACVVDIFDIVKVVRDLKMNTYTKMKYFSFKCNSDNSVRKTSLF